MGLAGGENPPRGIVVYRRGDGFVDRLSVFCGETARATHSVSRWRRDDDDVDDWMRSVADAGDSDDEDERRAGQGRGGLSLADVQCTSSAQTAPWRLRRACASSIADCKHLASRRFNAARLVRRPDDVVRLVN